MTGKKGDLEIDEDLKAQKRMWVFQRVGITFMILFALASLFGLIGPSGLASVTRGHEDDLKVEYQRSLHYRDEAELKVEVSPSLIKDGKAVIVLSRDYVERVSIEKVVPEPESVEATGGEYRYVFAAPGADRPLLAIFRFEPDDRGRLCGHLRSERGEPIAISQFVFP